MSPCISIIIPVYNGARFIRDALTSICTQTLLPAEIVIADDVSTDGTPEVALEYARSAPVPITVIRMDRNSGGPYGPASRVFPHTTGSYVAILDADDKFAPDAFETYMRMFDADPDANVGLATSDFLVFRDGTNAIEMPSFFARQRRIVGRIAEDQSDVGVLLERDEAIRMLAHAFVIPFKGMLSRAAWEALNGPNLRYRHACDCDFIWRLLGHPSFRVRVINRPLMHVRASGASMSSNRVLESRELVEIFRTMLRELDDPGLRRVVRGRLERELFDLTYNAYKEREIGTLVPAIASLAWARVRRAIGRGALQVAS